MEIYSYLSIYLPTYKHVSHIDYNHIIKTTNSGRFYFFILQKRKQSFRLSDLPEAPPLIDARIGIRTPSSCPQSRRFLHYPYSPYHLHPLMMYIWEPRKAVLFPLIAGGNMAVGQLNFFPSLGTCRQITPKHCKY